MRRGAIGAGEEVVSAGRFPAKASACFSERPPNATSGRLALDRRRAKSAGSNLSPGACRRRGRAHIRLALLRSGDCARRRGRDCRRLMTRRAGSAGAGTTPTARWRRAERMAPSSNSMNSTPAGALARRASSCEGSCLWNGVSTLSRGAAWRADRCKQCVHQERRTLTAIRKQAVKRSAHSTMKTLQNR